MVPNAKEGDHWNIQGVVKLCTWNLRKMCWVRMFGAKWKVRWRRVGCEMSVRVTNLPYPLSLLSQNVPN